jgi:hypothetical protein
MDINGGLYTMITYSWNITALNTYPEFQGEQDVVFTIFATYVGTDGTFTSNIEIAQALIISSSSTYTPYADLTENQVLGWLTEALGPQQISQMQLKIANQIAADNQPPFVQLPLPWSN